MLRLAIVLLFLAAPAIATVYQCRDVGGNLFLTDDPENFPDGCRSEGILIDGAEQETGRIPPASPREGAEDEVKEEPRPAQTAEPTRNAPGREIPPVLKEEAEELAREYRETSEGAESAEGEPSRQERLQQLEALADELRQRLDRSSLTPAQREEIEALLPPR